MRVQRIDFKEFMTGQYKEKICNREVKSYSVVFMNPAAFFDPMTIGLGAVVLGGVLLERQLAKSGFVNVAQVIDQSMLWLFFTVHPILPFIKSEVYGTASIMNEFHRFWIQ
jgi:hypothetical protein